MMTGLPVDDRFSETAKKVTTFTHWWTIKNFRFHRIDKSIESPLFSAGFNDGLEWKLFLHPDGDSDEDEGFLSIYLKMVSCIAREASVTHKISIFNADQESKATMRFEEPCIFMSEDRGWGWGRVIERDEVLSLTNFPGDTLIVRSEISYAAEEVPPAPSLNIPFPPGVPDFQLSAAYRELLGRGVFPDVIFKVGGKEFRAHKAILTTRAPIFFKRMLGQNYWSSRLVMEDPDAFSDLLNLIYSGNESFQRIQNLLPKIATHGFSVRNVYLMASSSGFPGSSRLPTPLLSARTHQAYQDEVTEKPFSENIEVVPPSEKNKDI